MRFYAHLPRMGTAPPLGAALTPPMHRSVWAWSSRGKVFGQPGTMGIPVPDPAAMREDVNSLASVGVFFSGAAPNVIFPPLYWEDDDPLDKEHAPVSRISDDQMPVPVGRARGQIPADPYRARKGGQRQVVQPQVVQTWKGMFSR